jgi:ATP-dependent RNA helicase SUPV3L1/SUV3
MGALSPRTRNAQVAMYQEGEVDYLVATDAIGMGLNLDIDHVAFSALTKFDGRRMRPLAPNELAQIAGRAGRGQKNGTFGTTGDAPELPAPVARAIEDHSFTPLKKLIWRNPRLEFGTIDRLVRSLEAPPDREDLVKAREADDLIALKTMADDSEIRARASDGASVRLLWDVCRVPDFRGISAGEHASLLTTLFNNLHEHGTVPQSFVAGQVTRLDRTDGDIDTLSKRLAFIRTWTYVAQRKGWVQDEKHWRSETRAVEDRLSDALHDALTKRFVDRRTSILLRRLGQKEAMVAEVNDAGEVTVEGEFVGRLEGFRFTLDKSADGNEAKTVKTAALQALAPHFHLRADRFYNAPDTEIDFTEQGGLMWGSAAVGKLLPGDDPLAPRVEAFVDDVAGPDVAGKVARRLQHFIDRKIAAHFEPLLGMQKDETLTGLAKGFAFRLVEGFGIIPRSEIADEVKALDQDMRGLLRKHGVRFGQFTIFMPLLLKPAPTRLRLVLWALAQRLDVFPEAPPPGLVTVPGMGDGPAGADTMAGYRNAGDRAVRLDMLERLADMLRSENSRAGFEANADMLSITGLSLEQFASLMQGLGYTAERGERPKVKAAKAEEAAPETPAETSEAGAADSDAAAAEAAPDATADAPADAPAPDTPDAQNTEAVADTSAEAVADADANTEAKADTDAATTATDPETEVFFTFRWGGNRPNKRGGQAPRGRDRPQGGKGKPKGKRKDGGKPQRGGDGQKGKTFSAKPPRKEKPIDPDNPFAAALMGLKDGK